MEKNSDHRQRVQKYRNLFSLPYLLSYFLQTLYGMADLFMIGQFEGRCQHNGRLRRLTGHAYAHRHDRRAWPWAPPSASGKSVGAGQPKAGRAGHRKHRDAVYGGFRHADGNSACTGSPHRFRDVHPGRSIGRHSRLSHHLLDRDPVYHGVQYHQFHFPRSGRQQKPDVLHRRGLRREYRSGLSFYGRSGTGTCGRGAWHNAFSGGQRSRFAGCDPQKEKHCSGKERFPSLPPRSWEKF